MVLEEMLRRLPDFEVIESGVTTQPDVSIIHSYATLPITFTPGAKERTGQA